MTWYCLGLAGGIKHISEGAWRLAWAVSTAQASHDDGNAIFRKVGADNRLILYFTPSSYFLAESFGAKPCAKPTAAGISLVAGSERALQVHFGGTLGLRRGIRAFEAFQRMVRRAGGRQVEEPALNRHIRSLFHQAGTMPREDTSMPLALAVWALDNLPQMLRHELQPVVEALRQAELRDPVSFEALLEEADPQITKSQSLHDAAWVLLGEAAEWLPAPR